MARIHVQTLGCRLNQAESERIARAFLADGHELVTAPAEADLRVVNTCTVTAAAGRDSRAAVRRLRPDQRVVATGCHADRHAAELSAADWVVGNAAKDDLAHQIRERFDLEGPALGMDAPRAAALRHYPPALRTTRAFVKIQDGCDLRCSFCLTAIARGPSRSRDAEDIVEEIDRLAAEGCQEAVLTGVHAGSYALDGTRDLGWLVDRILTRTAIPRLRLSSLEPWNFRPDWAGLWSAHAGRLCPHLHMSLQSGSAGVLRRMRRRYDPETFAERLAEARRAPGVVVTTDLIAGFPGETEEEHRESLEFTRACGFAGAHVFPYSARPGTEAARMPGTLPAAVRKARARELSDMVGESATALQRQLSGTRQRVLWERAAPDGSAGGLTDTGFAVHHPHGEGLRNQLVWVAVRWDGKRLVAEGSADQS